MTALIDDLIKLLEPTISAMGYQLWGIEHLTGGRHSTLRLFIDSEKGVEIDDCVAVSRQVSGVLDVEDPISGEYNLEVSSPGMDRLLFNEAQYQQFCGDRVKVKLNSPIQGRRNFTGRLTKVVDGSITLSLEETRKSKGNKQQSNKQCKERLETTVGRSLEALSADQSSSEISTEKGGINSNDITIGIWQISRGQVVPVFD